MHDSLARMIIDMRLEQDRIRYDNIQKWETELEKVELEIKSKGYEEMYQLFMRAMSYRSALERIQQR